MSAISDMNYNGPLLYAIGDIHGQYNQLRVLLATLLKKIKPEDQLIFLGDYIDRGGETAQVLECLIELQQNRPETIFLRGNHEQLMLDAMECIADNGDIQLNIELMHWLQNGGLDTLKSYSIENIDRLPRLIPLHHLSFLKETAFEYETRYFHFVHAGLLPPGASWSGEEDGLDPRLWIREPFLSYRPLFKGRTVVFGHTPQLSGKPLVEHNKIGIDTAAVFGGPLTAVALPDEGLKSAKCKPLFYQTPHC